MSTLEYQFLAVSTRLGTGTAVAALAEWLILDDPTAQLENMLAVRTSGRRFTASTLKQEHIGARVSFARIGDAGANVRIAGTLKRIAPAVRANGMPGYRLFVRGELHGPLAPHHEVIVEPSRAKLTPRRFDRRATELLYEAVPRV
ncbi:hypothetical protein NB037_03165 [Rathayibacter sp. ZW T2_19]|uniref:Uncharacterized protein n=1 Tax=Rathayibacter rubneri TaxID=2950106 RepID=A0A9X2DVR4_9MICO|nr:hypothetical protein [Rathayibacter rubneri]MCM6761408.1 hypothetical protein [Rathayibacter rubneri]